MSPKKVIVIEDDKMLSTVFKMFLSQMGYEIIGFFTSADEALNKIENNLPEIILMDIILPGKIDGIEAAKIIYTKYNIPVIFISSSNDEETAKKAIETNAYGYLVKPIDKFSMQISIEMAINQFNKQNAIKKETKPSQQNNDSENKYNIIKNNINEALFFFDKDSNLIETNNLADTFTETLKEHNIYDFNIYNILSFLPKHEIKNLVSNVLVGISHYLERQASINEINRFFKIALIPIEINNKVDKYCLTIADITESKNTENELKNVKNDLSPIFHSSIQRFYLLDLNANLISFNEKAFEIIQKEYRHNLTKGDSMYDFVPAKMGVEKFKSYFEKAKQGNHISYKQHFDDNILKEFWTESHLDPVINDKGEIHRILLWTLDITESEKNIVELSKSQERYELIATGGNDGIWDWDIEKDNVYMSPRWKAVLGYKDHEIENKFGTRDSIVHPEDLEQSKTALEKHLKGETDIFEVEIRFRHKNGKYIWILERGIVIRNDKGEPTRMAGSIADITDKRKMNEAISETNKILLNERSLFNNGDVVVMRATLTNNGFEFKYVSKNANEVLGYSSEYFTSKDMNYNNIIHIDDIERHNKEREDALINGGKNIKYSDYRIIKGSGEIIWVRDFTVIIENNDTSTEMLGYYIDITKYKNIEQKIKNSKHKYSSIFNKANDAIFMIKDCKIIEHNEAAERIFLFNNDDFKKLEMSAYCPDNQPNGSDSIEKFKRKIKEAENGNSEPFDWVYKRKDNTIFDAEISLTIINIEDEQYIHTLIRDITAKKEIERKLQKNKDKLNSIYDAIPDIIFVMDKQGNYLDYKRSADLRIGVGQNIMVGKNLSDFFDKPEILIIIEKINKAIETGSVQLHNYTLNSKIGKRNFESRISRMNDNSILSIVRDITEEKCS